MNCSCEFPPPKIRKKNNRQQVLAPQLGYSINRYIDIPIYICMYMYNIYGHIIACVSYLFKFFFYVFLDRSIIRQFHELKH